MNTINQHVDKNANCIGFFIRNKHLYFPTDQIIRLESESNYTRIYFTNHVPILMARVLHKYEKMLEPFGFIRTHRSHLVNAQYICVIESKRIIQMCDQSKAEISRRRRSQVIQALHTKAIAG